MNTLPQSPLIAVCIATYKRPTQLKRLFHSLIHMRLPENVRVELRVIDNDRDASAKSAAHWLMISKTPFAAVHYKIQKEQNIALSRNAALDIGPADAVVFVDDDEFVSQDWLCKLWDTYLNTGADVVLGPVQGLCASKAPAWAHKGKFFNKPLPETGTLLSWKQTRTSNTLVDGEVFYSGPKIRFSPKFGLSGGSDSHLFAKLFALGGRFVSSKGAIVWEDIPAKRSTIKWLCKRWYRNGLIYEQVVSDMSGEPTAPIRAICRLIGASMVGFRGIIGTLAGDPSYLIKSLLLISLAWGGLISWLKPQAVFNFIAYKKNPDRGLTPPANKRSAPTTSGTRVAFLTNIISPYRAPVFQRLAKTPGWDFKVFTNADSEFDRQWNVDFDQIPTKRSASFSFKRKVRSKLPIPFEQTITLHIPFGLIWDLIRFRPRVVISHELGIRTGIAAAYCAIARAPLVVWAYQSRVSGSQGKWRRAWRRFLLGQSRYVVGMGAQSRDVLKSWGVPDGRIIDAPNAANHPELEKRIDCINTDIQVANIHKTYAKGKKLAIVVGRLVPLKGTENMIQAWQKIPESLRKNWQLVFIGDGPLSQLVADSNDPSIVQTGFVNPKSLAAWYQAADLHIFPSCGDVWGLVVNESSTFSTPTLCSIHAGCYDDLIKHGLNGIGIDFTAQATAHQELKRALERDDHPSLGYAAQQHIASFTLDRMAQSFRNAINLAIRPDRHRGAIYSAKSLVPIAK